MVARTGPEDECDPEVNSPNSLPDASDDPGDDETEGDPVHDGFGGAEAADAEDVDGWPGDAGSEDAEDDEE
jgi:hypothetical protein